MSSEQSQLKSKTSHASMEKPFHILVVDDNLQVLELTCRILERAGYTVRAASSGMEAMESVFTNRPLLMLLDRQLPDMDGLEVSRRIKQVPSLSVILVVIMSGAFTGADDQAMGLESGVDGYIALPVGSRELLARVEAYVRIALLTRLLREQAEQLRASNQELRHLNNELMRELNERQQDASIEVEV